MNKKSMTAQELAAHFEVSKRTILRYVDTLAMAGIPIYTSQGRGGGISIQDKFVINKAIISENEQKQILFALQGMSATQHIETKSILSRLQNLFNKSDKDWIEVDFSRWGNIKTDRIKFDTLKNAIINEWAISFTYHSSSGETIDRKVYPLKLVFKSKSWYLQAFCLIKNDYRTFKISRMRSAKILTDSFNRGEYHIPKIEEYEYQSQSNLIEVKLHFEPCVAYRVYDEFDEQDIEKNADGSLIAHMNIPYDSWLYGYIMSFGASVKVLEPQNIRDEIAHQAEKIKNKYSIKT
jgi:predicted DNA-binding transcriptional regulator YafY